MGCCDKISDNAFPKQGDALGKKAIVRFNYGKQTHIGTIIRDDLENDGYDNKTIILLEDGRVVLGSECQYSY